MKSKTVVEAHVDELKNNDWLYYKDGDEIVFVSDEKEIAEAAKRWKMSPEAVKAIKESMDGFVEYLVDLMHQDFEDMWDEIDMHT
jgi:hypothetical protein